MGKAVEVACAALILLTARVSLAQENDQQGRDADAAFSDRLWRELAPQTTGKIQRVTPSLERTEIAPSETTPDRDEPPVPTGEALFAERDEGRARRTAWRPAPPPDDRMPQRIADLGACRQEVAASRGVPWRRVVAGAAQLRWTVRPDGSVEKAEAVAVKDTDPALLTCVVVRMRQWQFAPPVDQRVRMTARLRF